MNLKRLLLLAPLILALLIISERQRASAAVGLFNFQANSVTTGINLSWQTGFEDNNLGFNLFRAESNDRSAAGLVNPSLIPSQSQGGGGASYEYLDDSVGPNILYYYWVETVGDSLAEPVPPVSAAWTTGSGLVTNTPAPTAQPTQTGTPTATATITATVDPGASVTATPAVTNTPSPTVTRAATVVVTSTAASSSGNQANPTATLIATIDNDVNSQPDSTVAASAEGNGDENNDESAPATVSEEIPVGPTTAAIAIQPTALAETASKPVVASNNGIQTDAESIGTNGLETTGTTLTGSIVESDDQALSTGILMLLIAGGVFLFGGGATAFILLRQSQQQEKSS